MKALRQTFLLALLLVALLPMARAGIAFAEDSTQVVQDSTVASESSEQASTVRWLASLPFEYVIQPLFSAVVFPFSEPLRYSFDNGVIDKGVDIVTFGEKRNIFLYPTMNLKPGTSTMVGFMYRHSDIAFDKDYLVLYGSLFANSDLDYGLRYSKKGMFDGNTYLAFAHSGSFDRDGGFVLLGTSDAYVQADSAWKFNFTVAHPLPIRNWTAELFSGFRIRHTGLPDEQSDIVEEEFHEKLKERGIYQDFKYFQEELTLSYNNTESPYVPTDGLLFFVKLGYTFVDDYKDTPEDFEWMTSDKNHDFVSLQMVLQRYFYFGTTEKVYQFSKREARKKRLEYADFSLDQTLKMWTPSNIPSWILERRVVALQLRCERVWEMEKGGMPLINYPRLSDRYPLRGYDAVWFSPAILSMSWEYRWPVDYYVDGVAFIEYAMFADEDGKWNAENNIRNSWGFGVRVRTPDMYFFRLQLGFHGLHGIHFIMTIAPEFQ